MLPDSDNGSRFFFLFPLYCLIDVRDAGGTQMVILRRNIPTCLPLYNQANIGQRDCPCLQIVWQPSRRRTVVGVLGYPIGFITGRRASPLENGCGKNITQLLKRIIAKLPLDYSGFQLPFIQKIQKNTAEWRCIFWPKKVI